MKPKTWWALKERKGQARWWRVGLDSKGECSFKSWSGTFLFRIRSLCSRGVLGCETQERKEQVVWELEAWRMMGLSSVCQTVFYLIHRSWYMYITGIGDALLYQGTWWHSFRYKLVPEIEWWIKAWIQHHSDKIIIYCFSLMNSQDISKKEAACN